MNAKELEVKNHLNRVYYADKKARALEMLVEQCRERTKRITGNSDSEKNITKKAAERLEEMQERFERQKFECINLSDEVSQEISRLNDIDLETVLIHRYLLFHTIEETAEMMNYSVRAVNYKHKKAIEKLCTLLHCFTLLTLA